MLMLCSLIFQAALADTFLADLDELSDNEADSKVILLLYSSLCAGEVNRLFVGAGGLDYVTLNY